LAVVFVSGLSITTVFLLLAEGSTWSAKGVGP